jgi:hypothetical protein
VRDADGEDGRQSEDGELGDTSVVCQSYGEAQNRLTVTICFEIAMGEFSIRLETDTRALTSDIEQAEDGRRGIQKSETRVCKNMSIYD